MSKSLNNRIFISILARYGGCWTNCKILQVLGSDVCCYQDGENFNGIEEVEYVLLAEFESTGTRGISDHFHKH